MCFYNHIGCNIILRCYPNVSAILRRHTKSCLLCFFNDPYISPFSQIFFLLVSALFYMFAVLEESIQAGALLRPKNGYLVWSHGASSVCARRAPGRRRRYSSCIIFVVYSTVGRTCNKKTAYLNFLCLLPMAT